MFSIEKEYGLETIKGLVKGEKNLSRLYGFILYSRQHPFVAMALQNSLLWDALDEISGPRWPIFAVKPLEKGEYRISSSGPGYTSFLVQTWFEPSSNLPILQDFGLKSSESLPCFVAFIWDDNDELQCISVPIKGKNPISVYNTIEEIVKVVAKAEQNVLPEYRHNVELFRNVSDELNALNCRHRLYTIGKNVWKFINFFKSLV